MRKVGGEVPKFAILSDKSISSAVVIKVTRLTHSFPYETDPLAKFFRISQRVRDIIN